MKIAFLVTHLLGTGHLARTARIADAFTMAGHDALVLSGGMSAPLAAPGCARLHPLPPVRSNEAFSGLFDGDGNPASDALLTARRTEIRDTIGAFAPDMLVTELFPFGRRKLAAEFETAIAAARGALIFASIRDILQMPGKTGRKEEAEARLSRYYDGVLFHGDTALVDLVASWPLPDALRPLVMETGYIGDVGIDMTMTKDGTDEILVSAGGGVVGDALFRAATEAAALLPEHRWRLLVGGAGAQDRIAALGILPPALIAEPTRPDFRALLARCRLAVLQCGYNTALDVVATGARSVFCPFEGIGETEQLQRARAMTDRYGCGLVRERALDGQALADAVRTCAETPKPDYRDLHLNGAAHSVTIVETALAAQA